MLHFTRLDEIRARRPLIHCICNYVTANDCANLALAVGASPIMAQAAEEMVDITAQSAATVLNTGTPDEALFDACLLCAREAAQRGRTTVLDPVGAGASRWRLRRISGLLEVNVPSVLRLNLSEARALLGEKEQGRGVDSAEASARERLACAKLLAARLRTVVLLTGPEDVVTDGTKVYRITGGSARMSAITGAGCMLSVLCGVFAAAEPDQMAAAALAAAFWKICAARAEDRAGQIGAGSFHMALLDAASTLSAQEFAEEAVILSGE